MRRLLLSMLIASVQMAFAGPKLSPDLPKSGGTDVIDVIVQFKNPPTKDDLQQLGPYGQIKKQLDIIHGVHLSVSLSNILVLQNNPAIAYVSPVRSLKGSLDITTQAVNANLMWQLGWDGTGVGVAVIDSGVASRHDLMNGGTSRVVYRQSFVGSQTAPDDYGHGTHVAGIIGSNAAWGLRKPSREWRQMPT
jgi:serine protease AprX